MQIPTGTWSIAFQPVIGAIVGVLALSCAGAAAQTPRPKAEVPYPGFSPFNLAPNPPADSPDTKPQGPADLLRERSHDLEAIRAEQRKAAETEARLRSEIQAIGGDRRKLSQQLIDSAARIRAVEEQVAQAQDRLNPLDAREQELRKSFDARAGEMAEVLAALQRIGRHPPPFLVVEAEDALASVRSAMKLGAV
jgi:septal ring factor EnvC (AmiA/AmiB activator)